MDGSGATIDTLARGVAAQREGRAAEAEAGFRAAYAAAPEQPMAAYLLGRLLLASHAQRPDRVEEATLLLRHALALRPDDLDTRRALAEACLAAGWLGEAIDCYRAVLARRPDDTTAALRLAGALLQQGDAPAALATAEPVLRLAPALAEAWHVTGAALRALGRHEPAQRHLQRAVQLDPSHARAWMSLGHVAADRNFPAAAEAYLREAVACAPTLAAAHASLGAALTEAGSLPQAIAACDQAIALAPADPVAHWHRATAHLLNGDFAAGWADFEWRKQHPRFAADFPPLPGPAWDGTPLAGRSLLLRAEQGLGDTIQFARFLPGLAAQNGAAQGGRVILACRPAALPALAPLLAQLPIELAASDAAPAADCHADLGSLPHLLAVRPATIPGATGYLRADPARMAHWWPEADGFARVGLVWAGNPAHRNDARRSLPPSAVAAILAAAEAAPRLRFASLQKGPRAIEATTRYGLADHSAALTDFAATAAAIARLDLVITVDSAVAHLAGAMAKPTWLLLPFAPDWRWLLNRSDTPWYTSLRLFRQTAPGDWSSVAARVAAALIAGYRDSKQDLLFVNKKKQKNFSSMGV
ncbi:MAG TPA: tetratricopeptide repeat-containing glycosyltransferase family protein [Acetobacteraceae bacterium]|nr:tetratricopeptide repeat-containing glycosyltransferase family protein [Acetobacteraceae bacterium]